MPDQVARAAEYRRFVDDLRIVARELPAVRKAA
jgi:hypothetical protein